MDPLEIEEYGADMVVGAFELIEGNDANKSSSFLPSVPGRWTYIGNSLIGDTMS